MAKKKIDKKTITKWVALMTKDGIIVDSKNKTIEIDVPLSKLHKVTQERIKTLQTKNKFKVFQQLDLFESNE